jgi:hypothetical protein
MVGLRRSRLSLSFLKMIVREEPAVKIDFLVLGSVRRSGKCRARLLFCPDHRWLLTPSWRKVHPIALRNLSTMGCRI